uniref:Uncharacterized protein n=1 Tax=Globisporangium ultimum (strain ATCC 200006 / CBS 805.95 / DAOM BR144) TaxID=431595 RepID=K3XCF8_GLOUD
MTEPYSGEVQTPTNPYHRDTDLKSVTVADNDVEKEFKGTAESPKKTKKFFWWRLTKGRWIAAVVGSVVVVIGVILLILWFAVVGAIFQHNANKVHVALNYLDIVGVEKGADARNIDVVLSLRLKHHISFHAKTDATKVQLVYEGEKFAALDLPALDLKTGKQEYDLLITGNTEVTNLDAFAKLGKLLVTDKTLSLDVSAKLTAHALGLTKGGLKFERTLDVNGLNNFKDPLPVIDILTVEGCDTSTVKIGINASAYNVAQVGLNGVGALNLSLYYNNEYLGYAMSAMPELGVPRGYSHQLFDIVVALTASTTTAVSTLIKQIALGTVEFHLTGDNEYITEVGYLKAPLEMLDISISYKNQLKGLVFDPKCSLTTLVSLL